MLCLDLDHFPFATLVKKPIQFCYPMHHTFLLMYIFLQVPGGTADSWFIHTTSFPSTSPPSSESTATELSIDITVTKDADKDSNLDHSTDEIENEIVKEDVNEVLTINDRGRKYDLADPEQVTSENMWERTEVLAGEDRFQLNPNLFIIYCPHMSVLTR